MTLDYNILWFEDEETWYEGILLDVTDFLNEKGFTLISERKNNDQGVFENLDIDEFDLILIDYNLIGEKGDEIINKIRQLEIYTDIVFYSQSGETLLRNSIKEKGLDGVYCADREQSDFIEKVKKIINTTIKKIVEPNHVRGLVMSYASELDLKMVEITKEIINSLNKNEQSKQKETIKLKFLESLNSKTNEIQKIDSLNDIDKLFDKIDSYHKWRAIKRLCHSDEQLKEFMSTVDNYKLEVIDIRNMLAHVKETTNADGKKIIKSKFPGHEDFELNDLTASEIRINLRKHSELFEKISKSIHKN